MLKKHCYVVLPVLILALAALACSLPAAAENEQADEYVENEWNFVDEAMDISQGIPDQATGILGRIERNGVLRVAVQPDLAPYICTDQDRNSDGALKGADICLASLIAERMGVELSILELDAMQILPALTEEQCDLTISAVSFTPSRALNYTMSKGYYYPESEPNISFLIHKDSQSRIRDLADMKGCVIITQSNSLAETVGTELLHDYLEFRRVSSVKAVYEAVEKKTVDVGIVDINITRLYLENNPDCGLHVMEDLVYSPARQYQGYRVCAKKGETQLIAFVNGVIDEILESGEYESWLEETM
ncbi:MAG: amino acid ABC transporter substrate-binding protein [Blautia sp.]|nr:amino acid ABC transporter substrate-binding protein [Blautia sp.]